MGNKLELSPSTSFIVLDDIARYLQENLDGTIVRVVKDEDGGPKEFWVRQWNQLGDVIIKLKVEGIVFEERNS